MSAGIGKEEEKEAEREKKSYFRMRNDVKGVDRHLFLSGAAERRGNLLFLLDEIVNYPTLFFCLAEPCRILLNWPVAADRPLPWSHRSRRGYLLAPLTRCRPLLTDDRSVEGPRVLTQY